MSNKLSQVGTVNTSPALTDTLISIQNPGGTPADVRVPISSLSNVVTNYLGYAQITSNFTTTSTSPVQVTGLTATVTIPAGGRKVKITAWANSMAQSAGVDGVVLSIWDGTVGSGTQLANTGITGPGANYAVPSICIAVVSPSAGSKTYNVGFDVQAGTGTLNAAATGPAFILVELI